MSMKGGRRVRDKMASRCFYGRNSSIIKLMPFFLVFSSLLLFDFVSVVVLGSLSLSLLCPECRCHFISRKERTFPQSCRSELDSSGGRSPFPI